MKFNQPITNIIKARSSVRTYNDLSLDIETGERIMKLLNSSTKGIFGSEIRFELIQKKFAHENNKVKIGTYGFISGASYFIAGCVKNSEYNFEDFGYQLEKIILRLTSLELGTCWIGGTFSRSDFAKILGTSDDEIIPCITPVGFPKETRTLRERLIRWGAKSDSRKPRNELFFNNSFETPLNEELAGKFATVLEMVRLAPSASNKQPWRIVKKDNRFHFFLQRTKGYDKMIKSSDLQRVDMGIAMCHFDLCAKEMNMEGKWTKNAVHAIDLKEDMEYSFSFEQMN